VDLLGSDLRAVQWRETGSRLRERTELHSNLLFISCVYRDFPLF